MVQPSCAMSHLTRLEFCQRYLGFDDFDSYVGNSPKHGASVGPVAGRIAGATFKLNGKTYDLEVNNASNCNHSGQLVGIQACLNWSR